MGVQLFAGFENQLAINTKDSGVILFLYNYRKGGLWVACRQLPAGFEICRGLLGVQGPIWAQ